MIVMIEIAATRVVAEADVAAKVAAIPQEEDSRTTMEVAEQRQQILLSSKETQKN